MEKSRRKNPELEKFRNGKIQKWKNPEQLKSRMEKSRKVKIQNGKIPNA
jgi:hypothetical protein